MLGQFYKFHFVNNLGFDMDLSTNSAAEIIELNLMPWKLDATGAVVYGSEVVKTYSATDVADGVSAEFAESDNSSDLNIGLHGEVNFLTDDASAVGTVDIYIEHSTDGGTTYPSDAADFDAEADLQLVVTLSIAGDGAGYKRSTNFEI